MMDGLILINMCVCVYTCIYNQMFIGSLSPKYILKVQNKKNSKCALNFRRTIVFVSTLNTTNLAVWLYAPSSVAHTFHRTALIFLFAPKFSPHDINEFSGHTTSSGYTNVPIISICSSHSYGTTDIDAIL